jgi:hypothetical protein
VGDKLFDLLARGFAQSFRAAKGDSVPGTPEPWSDQSLAPWQFVFQDQVLNFFVFDPDYNSLIFDINSNDLKKLHIVRSRGAGERANPNLSGFEDQGGKLIIYRTSARRHMLRRS